MQTLYSFSTLLLSFPGLTIFFLFFFFFFGGGQAGRGVVHAFS